MVIIDTVINNLFGGLTLDPAGMHCPFWDDAFVSSSPYIHGLSRSAVFLYVFFTSKCTIRATTDFAAAATDFGLSR